MNVGFTGTQEGMTLAQYSTVLGVLLSLKEGFTKEDEFHHGDCIGADAEAHDLAEMLGFKTVSHPPIKENKRAFKMADVLLEAKDYLIRNHDIVDACTVMIATPKEKLEVMRSGTWATVRYSRKKNRLLYLILPNGSTIQ